MTMLRMKCKRFTSYGGITRIRFKGRRFSLPLSLSDKLPGVSKYNTEAGKSQFPEPCKLQIHKSLAG